MTPCYIAGGVADAPFFACQIPQAPPDAAVVKTSIPARVSKIEYVFFISSL